MKQHDKYKLSNIRWINQIPNDWKEVRNKGLFKVVKKIVGKSVDDFKVLSLTLNGIIYRDLENKVGKMPKDFEGYQIVEPENIVLCLFDMDVTPRIVGYSDKQGLVSSAYTVIKAKDKTVNPQYYYYWFLAMDNNKALLAETKGLRNTMKDSDLMSLISASPSIEEQGVIVDTLHIKLQEIGDFIKQKQKSIELLKEYKQSKINELVTKGINPNIKTKDSGIKWLGDIPENWEVIRLKLLLKKPLQYGANESGEEITSNSLRYIRITDFTNDNVLSEKNKLYLTKEKGQNYRLNENDLLFARSGATAGKVFICTNLLEESCYAGYLIRAVVNTEIIIPKYLYYYMHSSAYNNWISYTFIKSTIENISATKYENLIVPIPTIIEQEKILKIIDNIENEYKEVISKVEKQIELIQQYRQSLIYELVTGKRKP